MLSNGAFNRTYCTAVAIRGGESSRFPVVLPPSIKSPSLLALVVRCLAVERRSGVPEVAAVLSLSGSLVVRNIRDGDDVIEVEIGKRQRRQVLINLTSSSLRSWIMKTVHELFLTRFAMFAVKQPHLGEQLESFGVSKGWTLPLRSRGIGRESSCLNAIILLPGKLQFGLNSSQSFSGCSRDSVHSRFCDKVTFARSGRLEA